LRFHFCFINVCLVIRPAGITQERAEEILADYARKMNDVVTDDENSLPQVCIGILYYIVYDDVDQISDKFSIQFFRNEQIQNQDQLE